MTARRIAAAAAAASVVLLGAPAKAFAHGIASRSDLPIPGWLYGWAAAAVLAFSFFAFAAFWREPILEDAPERTIARIPVWLEALCGAIGVATLAAIVYAGFAGSQISSENVLVVLIYVIFWAGLPLFCAIFGNIFAAFNPWRAIGRFAGWVTRGVTGSELPPAFNYPERLGRWPALALLIGFGWLELVSTSGTDASFLATMIVFYVAIQLVGMSLFGADRWLSRGDAFGVYFDFFGRMAPLAAQSGYLVRRRFLSGLSELEWMPGTVTFICAMIGITAFDGFSGGAIWSDTNSEVQDFLVSLGFAKSIALQISFSAGMLLAIGVVAFVYRLGVLGMSNSSFGGDATGRGVDEMSRTFAPSLVPIALAYVVAHYFSFVVFEGQSVYALISNPLGNGTDYFGTAGFKIDYAWLSAGGIWWVQVVALVGGHVLALAVAHDKALAVFGHAKAAVRSQYWMLIVMVFFTNLGLWLLSVAND